MSVRFLAEIRRNMGLKRYSFARRLGVPTQSIDYYETCGQSLKLSFLVKLRKLAGLTWEELGKMLDKEFIEK